MRLHERLERLEAAQAPQTSLAATLYRFNQHGESALVGLPPAFANYVRELCESLTGAAASMAASVPSEPPATEREADAWGGA